MSVAIIPARGGSKRIPRKNIKEFDGKPMISWSIIAAVESNCFDRIVVSTDDDEIAAVAQKYGAEVPFKRPAELADDYTTTTDVIKHAIRWFQENDQRLQKVCVIYATAPMIMSADIRESMELAGEDFFSYPATTFAFPIQRAIAIEPTSGESSMMHPEHFATRSQDLVEAYHDTGQFYWGTPALWLDEMKNVFDNGKPLIIPRWRVSDIDTEEDWQFAEVQKQILQKRGLMQPN